MENRPRIHNYTAINASIVCLSLITSVLAVFMPPLMWAQTPFTSVYEFTGNTGCPTTNDQVTTQPSEAVFSTFSRAGVVCKAPANNYQNQEWSETSTLDPGKYVAFTITTIPTFTLNFSTSDDLSFFPDRSATGPANGEVRYGVDGGYFQTLGTFTPGASVSFTMPTLSEVSSVAFRIYAWNAGGAGGKMSVDDVQLSGTTSPMVTPVELVSFEALADGRDVVLRWVTASETNNAGFEIQRLSQLDDQWDALGWIDGHGTTLEAQHYGYRVDGLEPGRHTFRLKQIDYDGTFDFSPKVEVIVKMGMAFEIEPVYPNPFNLEARFRFTVSQSQPVRVELYDVQGRRLRVLSACEAASGRMHEVRIDGADLPSGLYLVRVAGASFAETRPVTLLK